MDVVKGDGFTYDLELSRFTKKYLNFCVSCGFYLRFGGDFSFVCGFLY